MTLLARGQSKTLLTGTRRASSHGGKSRAGWHRVPVRCHDQGWGQNGASSLKKTRTGITAQPTMS
jgi:hypothetical protein